MCLFPELTVLLQRGIVMGTQLLLQSCLQLRPFLRGATRNRFGPHMPLVSSLLEIAFDGGQGNAKQLHNLGSRAALVYRPQHSFA